MPIRYWAIIVLVGVIFGSSFLLIEIAGRELSPLTMAAGRAFIAAAASWAIVVAARIKVPTEPSQVLKLLGLGVLSYAFSFVMMPIIQGYISTGLVAMINLLLPIMTLTVSHFWPGGERATRLKALGAVVGFSGAIILALPSLASGFGGQAVGVFLCLLSTIAFALAFNITRGFAHIPPQAIAAYAMTGAMLATLPPAFLIEGLPTVQNAETWWAWLALGLFPTAFTFQVMYWMIPRVGVVNFSVNAYVGPIVATVLGVAILGEVVHPLQLVGIIVVMAGLLVIDGRLLNRFRKVRPVSDRNNPLPGIAE